MERKTPAVNASGQWYGAPLRWSEGGLDDGGVRGAACEGRGDQLTVTGPNGRAFVPDDAWSQAALLFHN
jgi:hypothetical protein